jgi:hypothetical protein
MWHSATAIVAVWAVFPADAVVVRNSFRATGLREPTEPSKTDGSVFKPVTFEQRLLVCNAYPSGASVTVSKNEKVVTDSKNGIGFKECRYIGCQVQPKDKLELTLPDLEIHSTFEVGDLPTTDAVLLLVLEKRSGSALVSFKSFAFASGDGKGTKEAQLAVIDAFHGNVSSSPHLKMSDHLAGKSQRVLSQRIEELPFNRVYAVEEGTYDASAFNTTKTVRLASGGNYVLLRMGDDMLGVPQSLVVFPDAQSRSLASRFARASSATWSTAVFAALILTLGR